MGNTGLTLLVTLGAVHARAADEVTFVAFGDAPYGLPGDEARFKLLTDQANELQPAFAVHIGGIKNGHSSCADAALLNVLGLFARFTVPLVYTPGDNEWTDCNRVLAGSFNPVERLARLRQIFFTNGFSLGRKPLKLERQSEDPDFATFVENAMWAIVGVQFATVHVVGSGNYYHHHLPDRAEYIQRNAANLAWIDRVFRRAADTGASAVVIAMHANPLFRDSGDSRLGFVDTQAAFARHAQAYGKPILLIHGDSHRYRIDQPLRADPIGHSGPTLRDFTHLEVFGSPETRGVIVTVHPDRPAPFAFKPMVFPYDILPGNGRP
ncbi:MAG: hypothetical protein EXQ92_13305 [Alphaproteobacteria bacterium]|nr:hypothetical protein [Alphaproteobacteria bacterium]